MRFEACKPNFRQGLHIVHKSCGQWRSVVFSPSEMHGQGQIQVFHRQQHDACRTPPTRGNTPSSHINRDQAAS